MELKQIEADVVIVLVNPVTNQMEVYPYWECDLDAKALRQWAANCAIVFVERCGSGYIEIDIVDHRTAA